MDRSNYWEVVRSNRGQPWRARLRSGANGRILARTEEYTRKAGAENAILATARTFGYVDPVLVENVPHYEKTIQDTMTAGRPFVSVVYIDERNAR